jgi:hypothetical protein
VYSTIRLEHVKSILRGKCYRRPHWPSIIFGPDLWHQGTLVAVIGGGGAVHGRPAPSVPIYNPIAQRLKKSLLFCLLHRGESCSQHCSDQSRKAGRWLWPSQHSRFKQMIYTHGFCPDQRSQCRKELNLSLCLFSLWIGVDSFSIQMSAKLCGLSTHLIKQVVMSIFRLRG